MELPEGWKRLKDLQEHGHIEELLSNNFDLSGLIQEMAEALELNLQRFDHCCSGDDTAPTDSAWLYSEKVLKKFKEWK